MREMKDSGIPWIGEIPKEWEYIPFKYVVKDSNSGEVIDKQWWHVGDELLYTCQKTPMKSNFENFPQIKRTKCGDLLLTRNATPYVFMPQVNAIYSNVVQRVVVDCSRVHLKYVVYTLQQAADAYGVALGISIPSYNMDIWSNLKIPLPKKEVQCQIADFLDSKCAEIDALSNDIQSEIDTMEAYKRSVITEAVTKGLDKNVPMKDSGMSWIGLIPEHWRVEKVKYHLRRNEIRNPGNQIVLSVYRDYGVIPKDSRDDNHNVTSEDVSKYKYVKPGYLVINKMKAWQGSMGVSDYEGIVSPAYFIYEFIDNQIVKMYLHYLFRYCYKDEFRRISGGIREGQWDLSPEGFANTYLPLPSVREQIEIVEYINNVVYEIEALLADKEHQLQVLADYKKSIIYEYVTGKKGVPVA